MRIEMRGLVIAVMAAFVALAVTFSLAKFVRQVQTGIAAENTRLGDNSHGKVAPPAAPPAATIALTPADIASGHQFYLESCAACHGDNAEGAYGPNLHHLPLAESDIASIIKTGFKGKMPSFAKKYSDSQINDIVGYVRGLK